MKTSQRQRYAEKVERALEHLHRELENDRVPDLQAMAKAANMSPYHFHRVFRLMTGETVGEVIRRTRLARTLPDLQREPTIARAAAGSAYASQQSFARAMRGTAGVSAGQVRTDGAELERVAARLQASPAQGAPLRVEIVSLDPFRLLAIRNVGDYAELNAGYERLFGLVLGQIPPECLQGIYGVPHDDPRFVAPELCRFDCALAVGSNGTAGADLVELTLGGGDFLRLTHRGSYDALHERIDELYAAALTQGEREVGVGPLFIHYADDPDEVPEDQLTSHVYLPLG